MQKLIAIVPTYDLTMKTKMREKKFYCELCDLCFQAPSKLTRHKEGYRHKLKYETKNSLCKHL